MDTSPAQNGAFDKRAFEEMLARFDEQGFLVRMRRMLRGLRQPRGSGEYRFARFQLQRLCAPLCAVVVPLLALLLLAFMAQAPLEPERERPTALLESDPLPKLDPPPKPPETQTEVPDPRIAELANALSFADPVRPAEPEVRPPVPLETLAPVRSPVVLSDPFPPRGAPERERAIVDGGGNPAGENAVMRALRWLKQNQLEDGSWPTQKTAMTALALLAFVAHGETPDEAHSPEFATTVRKALAFLLAAQRADGSYPGNYHHPIVALALCEAWWLTRHPGIKEAAERAIAHLVRGQHPSGGWDYDMRQSERDDTSVMGWAAQAVKAARATGLRVEGLEAACRNAAIGLRQNADPRGGFGYTGPGRTGLSATGVLCLQILGHGDAPEVKRGLAFLEACTCSWESWDRQPYGGGSPLYYWYYVTQAKFHARGKTWEQWNRQFSPTLIAAQQRRPPDASGYVDHRGTPQAVGWWDSPSPKEHSDGRVQDTCLCVLQLEVYYRHLASYATPEATGTAEVATAPSAVPLQILGLDAL